MQLSVVLSGFHGKLGLNVLFPGEIGERCCSTPGCLWRATCGDRDPRGWGGEGEGRIPKFSSKLKCGV